MIKLVKISVAVAIMGSLVLISGAMAEATGNIAVDNRIAAMKNLGKNMKAIAAVAKGQAEYSAALNANAAEVARIAKTITSLFEEKVVMEGSRAKAEIWTDMKDFKLKAEALVMASEGLIVAVRTGDQGKIGAALGATGKNCGGCHKPYRIPKK